MTRNTKPRSGNCGANSERANDHTYAAAVSRLYGNGGSPDYLPRNWRNRLPDPTSYYHRYVECLGKPNADGWAKARCPFHDDHHPSLSVCLSGRGRWQCFAGSGCGHGDLVAFHMKRTGLPFKQAVRDLIGLGGCHG